MSRLIAVVALLACAALANAVDRLPAEEARIEYLLAVVASLHDAQFIRNGTAYDSTAAVKHFIHYCGSASSISGKPYEIRFPDGRVIPSADFLRQKLVDFDRASGPR